MSGTFSRNKGQRGEREVIKMLQPIVDKVLKEVKGELSERAEGVDNPKNGLDIGGEDGGSLILLRNQLQTAVGGADLTGIPWIAIEVKYQETENLNTWWKQTLQQAGKNKIPVLIWRKNHGKWRVRMFGAIPIHDHPTKRVRAPVDIELDAFLLWFEHELKSRTLKNLGT